MIFDSSLRSVNKVSGIWFQGNRTVCTYSSIEVTILVLYPLYHRRVHVCQNRSACTFFFWKTLAEKQYSKIRSIWMETWACAHQLQTLLWESTSPTWESVRISTVVSKFPHPTDRLFNLAGIVTWSLSRRKCAWRTSSSVTITPTFH